jgi:indole-3-glycerol phosphate synthase
MMGSPIAAEPSLVFSGYTLATLMPTKLEEIVAATRERVADAKTSANLPVLSQAAERHQPRRFRQGLRRAAKSGIAVIAELKKASPSKGLIRADFPVAELAQEL